MSNGVQVHPRTRRQIEGLKAAVAATSAEYRAKLAAVKAERTAARAALVQAQTELARFKRQHADDVETTRITGERAGSSRTLRKLYSIADAELSTYLSTQLLGVRRDVIPAPGVIERAEELAARLARMGKGKFHDGAEA
jgi:hypothetical protein